MQHDDTKAADAATSDDRDDATNRATRKRWQEPVLERHDTLPRVTNGFAGSFPP